MLVGRDEMLVAEQRQGSLTVAASAPGSPTMSQLDRHCIHSLSRSTTGGDSQRSLHSGAAVSRWPDRLEDSAASSPKQER
jgi:hypothetical protein